VLDFSFLQQAMQQQQQPPTPAPPAEDVCFIS